MIIISGISKKTTQVQQESEWVQPGLEKVAAAELSQGGTHQQQQLTQITFPPATSLTHSSAHLRHNRFSVLFEYKSVKWTMLWSDESLQRRVKQVWVGGDDKTLETPVIIELWLNSKYELSMTVNKNIDIRLAVHSRSVGKGFWLRMSVTWWRSLLMLELVEVFKNTDSQEQLGLEERQQELTVGSEEWRRKERRSPAAGDQVITNIITSEGGSHVWWCWVGFLRLVTLLPS